jgi:hypothetical protein
MKTAALKAFFVAVPFLMQNSGANFVFAQESSQNHRQRLQLSPQRIKRQAERLECEGTQK